MPHASCFTSRGARPALERLLVVALPTIVLGTVLVAQEQEPTFRAGTTLVEVSAIVTHDGVPVTNLRQEDVRVLDNGVEQQLVAFEYVDLTTVVGPAQRRDFVLVIDDWHIEPRLTKPAQDVALRLVDALGPDDRLAIVNTGPHDIVQLLSTDREKARRLIRRVRGQAGDSLPGDSEMRARTALRVVRRVAGRLWSDAAERRAVVLISQGHALFAEGRVLSHNAELVRADYHDVLREAALANVAIYGIDPRGLLAGIPTLAFDMGIGEQRAAVAAAASVGVDAADSMGARHFGSLGLLAMNTGGTLTVDTNDLGKHIPGIMQDSRQYYRLAYVQPELAEGKAPSQPRRIEVEVDRPRVEVRARQRYVPKS